MMKDYKTYILNRIKISQNNCWEWQKYKNKDGYGRFSYLGTTRSAHTVAFRLWRGPIPDGEIVRHDCDNPPCCNPEHLRTGTKKDNKHDSVNRNRHIYGEKVPKSKLSETQVKEIIALLKENQQYKQIGEKYNVSPKTVGQINRMETWKHLSRL